MAKYEARIINKISGNGIAQFSTEIAEGIGSFIACEEWAKRISKSLNNVKIEIKEI